MARDTFSSNQKPYFRGLTIFMFTVTLVPEVFLDFSLLGMREPRSDFAALSSISHLNAEKNQEKRRDQGSLQFFKNNFNGKCRV